MRKILLILLSLLVITCQEPYSVNNGNYNGLENLKIGDIVNIARYKNNDFSSESVSTTFDYTGLGIDDSYSGKIMELSATYFDGGTDNYNDHISIIANESNEGIISSYNWVVSGAGGPIYHYYDITNNIFKVITDTNVISYGTIKVVVTVLYHPDINTYKLYTFEGLHNGNGKMELVALSSMS